METVRLILQLVVALMILNVWLFRFNKVTPYRAGTAKNMKEEFAAYGLPPGFMYTIGSLKVLVALCLIAGTWVPELTRPAAMGLAALMLGAVAMHVRVRDPLKKAAPALTVLFLSLIVAVI